MRLALIVSLLTLSGAFHGDAISAELCSTLDKHTLYLVNSDNAQKVIPYSDYLNGHTNISLHPNSTYKFFYRTDDTPVVNSLVAVQIKYLGLVPSEDGVLVRRTSKKPVGVNLERDATPFACGSKSADYSAYKYVDYNGGDKAVDSDNYDLFHRWGILATDDGPVLNEQFHIFYHRDMQSRCVRSDEGPRAALFLVHARNAIPGRLERLAYRTGFSNLANNLQIARAYGADVRTPSERRAGDLTPVIPYLKMKMLLTNYQKESMSSGCFSFSASTTLPNPNEKLTELDVSFSDLEESVSHYQQPNWNYQAEYKFQLQ
jgi:hypothetical protein